MAKRKPKRNDQVNPVPPPAKRITQAVEGRDVFVSVKWKTPGGEDVEKQVTITHPTIRVANSAIVHTKAFLRLATGEKLTEEELKQSPALATETKQTALHLIRKYAKIQCGFIKEK